MGLINSRAELRAFAQENRLRPDWHEPDEQEVGARVVGDHLDNAMGAAISGKAVHEGYQEFVVVLTGGRTPDVRVNLANLLAWAAGAEDAETSEVGARHGEVWCYHECLLAIGIWRRRVVENPERPQTGNNSPGIPELAEFLERTPGSPSRRVSECAALAHEEDPEHFSKVGLGADRKPTAALKRAWEDTKNLTDEEFFAIEGASRLIVEKKLRG